MWWCFGVDALLWLYFGGDARSCGVLVAKWWCFGVAALLWLCFGGDVSLW
jgi:hypothetical protein